MAQMAITVSDFEGRPESEIVKLYVGPKRKEYTVHKKPLFAAADFFEKAFNNFKEGEEGRMYLPEDHPGALALFVEWVYQTKIPDGHSQYYVDSLYELYIFAEKICPKSKELEDRTMDKIQDVSQLYDLIPNPAMILRVYENTVNMSILKLWCVLCMVYLSFENPKEIKSFESASDDKLEVARTLSEKNFDFFKDYMKWMSIIVGEEQASDERRVRSDGVKIGATFTAMSKVRMRDVTLIRSHRRDQIFSQTRLARSEYIASRCIGAWGSH